MLKIVRVDFPLLDKPGKVKSRPALCLTEPIGKYKHVIVAPITSKTDRLVSSDVVLDPTDSHSSTTALSKMSAIQLHKMVSLGETRLQVKSAPSLKRSMKMCVQSCANCSRFSPPTSSLSH